MKDTIITPRDVMSFFSDKVSLVDNYNDRIYHYVFKEFFGKGFIHRMIINSDTEVWDFEYTFKSDLIMLYDMPEDIFEIAYCLDGQMEHYSGNFDKKNSISAGQMALFGRKNTYGYAKYLKDTCYKGVSVITSKDYVENKVKFALGASAEHIFDYDKVDKLFFAHFCTPDLAELFQNIHKCSLKKASKLMLVDGLANQCIAMTYDQIKSEDLPDSRKELTGYDIENIRLAKDILVSDLANPPSIMALSKAIGVNSTKLKQDFKKVYGTTVYGYLRDMRLSESKKMLVKLDMTIANIAAEVGYSNASKFALAFKKRYGINPKDIRKSNKG